MSQTPFFLTNMKRALATILFIASCPTLADMNFLEEAQIGQYILIGKAVDSNRTYLGKVEIFAKDEKLGVIRKIDGKTITGSAAIEPALNGDAEVLRIRFTESEKNYEETCLFRGDLDNNSRISCYLYQPSVRTSNPGLEALFYEHRAE